MFRRTIAIGAAAVAVAAVTLASGQAASADTVTVKYTCGGWGLPTSNRTFSVMITAPATAAAGQTVALQASLAGEPSSSSIEPDLNRSELDIHLGGANSGTVLATGLVNPKIEPGTPWRMEGGQARVTLANAGTVTFTPGTWRMKTYLYGCSVQNGTTAPVAATTRVS
jgi:hypothetical protein